MLQTGIVSKVLANLGKVRVTLPDQDEADTYELPILQLNTRGNTHYHLPSVGEQVYVLLDDNGEDGCVLGSIYSEADPPPLSDADQYAMIFEDLTAVKYDRNAHLMEVTFDDDTALSYDAEAHALKLKVSSSGTIEVTCEGNTTVKSNRVISLQALQSIALTAPQIALNTGNLTCTDPDSELGMCNAVFHGNLTMQSNLISVNSQATALTSPLTITGNTQQTGSITATGTITDTGGNTNHHEHPEYRRI